ncbi:MAG: universal stress protein [Acidobacteria bacterium]|nr:universal stress protein [Acidobacteriota bacterium]
MKQISKVLIAYDGSTCSDAALRDLKRAGLPEHLEAVVISVAALVFLSPDDRLPDDEVVSPAAAAMVSPLQQEARAALKHAHAIAQQGADRVKREFPGWTVSFRAEGDSPAWGVIKTATRLQSDLIVAGAHRHSSLGGRLIMGSVSQRVLYEADCPVRLARCSNRQREGPIRIIVGFDGAAESDAAVDAVASRVWPAETEARVVIVRDAMTLGEQLEKLRTSGLKTSEVIKHGDPAHVLLHAAEEWDADSIFVGSRDLHGFRHLLQGSVASAIAAQAQCSVEVVRHARIAA